jgi:peptide/nickel transport system substrate-binding protein
VDLAPMMNRMDVLTLKEDPRFQVYATPWPHRGKGIFWNHSRPPFDEARVRRALTLAIDRRELLRALSLPDETPLFDVIFTARQFRRSQLPPPLEADSAAAARLLAEAGWRDHDGDGIRDRGGVPFRFTALVPAGTESEELAVLVQARLRRFGIAMEIRPLGGDAVWRRRIAGDFDAVFGNHLMDFPGQGSPSAEWFGQGSAIGYENPSVAARLDSLAAALDPAEADRLHQAMWPDFQRDLPVTFLQPVVSWTVSRQRVRGLGRPHVLDPMSAVEELWIEENSN